MKCHDETHDCLSEKDPLLLIFVVSFALKAVTILYNVEITLPLHFHEEKAKIICRAI